MRPDANTAWFTFSSKSDPPGGFGVYAFSGKEAVCEPYEFEIELVSRSANVDIEALTGAQALLSIADRSGEKRLVHGIIRHMEQRHTANAFTHYKCWLVPRLWFLDQISDHRIFQNLSVDGIIQKILREQGFTAEQYAFKLCYKYEPREYCVQYGETDLHFITRLCEEEGIYFYFEHTEDVHRLCFCDREGGPNIAGEWDIRFFPGSGQAPDTAVINRLHLHYGVNSNASMYREWNFQTPKIDLTSREREPDAQKAPTPPGMLLEQYQYPHLYEDRQQGERYAKLQLGRQLTFVRWIECQSDVSRWLPSYVFNLHEHPREDVNGRWWIVRVLHEGKQPGVLEHEAPDGRGQEYQSAVQAIPDMTRFIPPLEHPKNLVKGQQTAIVTGPDGEEIYVDKYGRVKVQFFWDREGQWDEKTTCWIRVSQGWAGGQYGGMAIPRIGHEVIVSFLEGNPDRPLITGRVYHELNMPPYTLPEHKTRMTIKSKTHMGDGYNELRFEDMKGNEQIYIHGQRDQDIIIENDSREWVKGNEHLLVEKNLVEEIKGTSSTQASKDRMEGTGGERTVTVGGDEAHQVGGSWHQKVNGNVFLEGMTNGVIEMHKEITLKAPGGFIRIDGSGISIEGKVVNINTGGSAGAGFPVQAIPARSAERADSREAGSGRKSQAALTGQSEVVRSDTAEQPTAFGNSSFAESPVPGVNLDSSADALPKSLAPACALVLPVMRNAPIEVERLKISDEPVAGEWRKTVLDARQETSVSGKMETVNSFVCKNAACTPSPATTPQGPAALLQSGQGSSLDHAVIKYHTLQEAGVPADSMRIVSTDRDSLLLVRDGQRTLVSGPDFAPAIRDSATLASDVKPVYGFNGNGFFIYTPV